MTNGGPTLGIGTAGFIGSYGLNAGTLVPGPAMILEAIDCGLSYIDTAASYGGAERVLGELAEMISGRGVRVATKVAVQDPREIVGSVEASLERLRLRSVDTLLLHSAGTETLGALAVARECGTIRARRLAARTGASTYGADDVRSALAQPWCDAVQFEYSLLNPSVLPAALEARRPGQELIARSVLCKGLLTARWREAGNLAVPLVSILGAVEELATTWGYTLPELAIRFALDTPGLDVVLVGVRSVDELRVAVTARDHEPLTPEQRRQLASFDASTLDVTHPERWTNVRAT